MFDHLSATMDKYMPFWYSKPLKDVSFKYIWVDTRTNMLSNLKMTGEMKVVNLPAGIPLNYK